MSGNKITALIIVALLHVVVGYALVTGLAYSAFTEAQDVTTAVKIEPDKPPPAAAAASAADTPPPPPIVAPPPPININTTPPPLQVVNTPPPPAPRRLRPLSPYLRLRLPPPPRPSLRPRAFPRVARATGLPTTTTRHAPCSCSTEGVTGFRLTMAPTARFLTAR
jgi:protein TonB